MRRIKMLEFVLRMERYVRAIFELWSLPDVDILARNNLTKLLCNRFLPRSLRLFRPMVPLLVLRMIREATRRKVVGVLLEARVRAS